MKMIKTLGILVSLLLLSACTNKNYVLLQSKKYDPNDTVKVTAKSIEYRILPQDRLRVLLYKDPTQSSDFGMTSSTSQLGQDMNKAGILVNARGYIILPLIGSIKVSGQTQTQAANNITMAYKRYLNTPRVYVEVMNKKIFVLGEVKKPGVIQLDKEKMTLFEALSYAGDLTDAAVRNEIDIISNDPKKGMQLRKIDLTNFDTMNYASLMLRPNDIVYVKPNNWKQFRVNSSDTLSPLKAVATVLAPFVTLKYLGN